MGLIGRERDASDRRVVRIVWSEEGRKQRELAATTLAEEPAVEQGEQEGAHRFCPECGGPVEPGKVLCDACNRRITAQMEDPQDSPKGE